MKPPAVIYCLGDSHTCFFTGQDKLFGWGEPFDCKLPFFRGWNLGPVLAYNLIKPNSTTGGREKLFTILREQVPAGSRVLLSFGEIDCRAHLIKHAESSQRPIADVVNDCLDRYFQVVEEVRTQGYTVIVYNAPPSSRRPNKSEFPSHGSARERNHVTRLFNAGLATRCANAGIHFLHTFPDLVHGAKASHRNLFFDHIHLAQRAMPVTLRRLSEMFPGEDFSTPPDWRRTVFWSRLSYVRRKLTNLGEYVHPAHVKAVLSGASAKERKEVRRKLRPQPLPHLGKQKVLREYATTFGPRIFIETGTFRGDMVNAMISQFAALHTIELAEDLAAAARTRFREHAHVTIHHGDSAAVLPRLLAHITEPCLFWLDGHSSGHDTGKGHINTPILAELNVIRHHQVSGHVILIDDAREFGRGKHYPTLALVREAIGPRYSKFEVKDDIIRITA